MKSNYSKLFLAHIVFAFLVMFNPVQVYGQEGDYFYEDEAHEDQANESAIMSPDEHYVVKEKSNTKTSRPASIKESSKNAKTAAGKKNTPPLQKPKEAPVVNEETQEMSSPQDTESPLSFNFLYYIIQKFKFSDVIDE
ncbi:hypothetical protein FNH22_04935 [Fulvivirga sp. M361]|uniref:hypothetical protein n=1 Tax=Fulvivirga sp. M361 TaxID=2594266 RepID=UPI001179C904|nr:hypothetical protein [Fulvivirga sp. M361]TRX61403.1 hypothetical protein FNH22_04935 [Fulvivirga sp. M361]